MTDRRNEHEDFIKERRRGQDRRAHERHSVAITMELTAGNDLYFHVSANLSKGGAYFNRAIPHPIGTKVQITFQLPGDDGSPIRCHGEVVNVPDDDGGLGMGVGFTSMGELEQERLDAFVNRVQVVGASESEPEPESDTEEG